MTDAMPTLLTIDDVRKLYPVTPPKHVHALDGVSLKVKQGEILGLVGESGSGKTTLAMMAMGLLEPTSGSVLYQGDDLYTLLRGRNRLAARRQIQMVFQDPYESLNPRQKIYDILAEPLRIHKLAHSREEITTRVTQALQEVGLNPPESFAARYPEALSGGQRQRVVIAAALILGPRLLVADEPISMLDVSMRAEILSLMRDLRTRHGVSILYITHDLATAGFFTDRVAVMYLGRIVEIGPTREILSQPQHPYTRALLSVVPVPNPRHRRHREILQGEIPSAIDLPSGCRFHTRCPAAIPQCTQIDPMLQSTGRGRSVACILAESDPDEHQPE